MPQAKTPPVARLLWRWSHGGVSVGRGLADEQESLSSENLPGARLRVGLLGLSQRAGRFNELGVRSWEESGCAEAERHLMAHGGEDIFYIHRPLVVRGGLRVVRRLLKEWCDAPDAGSRCDLILTVAGDGIAPRDIMPEATLSVIRRLTPGVADLVRAAGLAGQHPEAALSRGVAGTRKCTLIINIPGPDPRVVADVMDALGPVLPPLVQAVQDAPGR